MEVTKWLKPSISVSRIGDSASVQAATRVNVEQASKRKMCRPTRLPYRGRLKQLGELSEAYAQLLHRGIGGGMYTRKAYATREAPPLARSAMTNRTPPARDRSGALGWRERFAVPRKARQLRWREGDLSSRLTQQVVRVFGRLGNLSTPISVQKLQTALHAKAKAEAGYRFYALYDKISREDILAHAYGAVSLEQGRTGGRRSGLRGTLETYGVERWLGELALALREESYQPDPIRRVFIPKANGKLRPLGISTVRDRVCMTAAMLVLEPIFEADLPPEQYAYRSWGEMPPTGGN